MVIYLIGGLLLVAAAIWLSKKLATLEAETYRRVVKWGGAIFLLLVALVLLRAGWPIIAALVGGAGVLIPAVMRLLRIIGIVRFVHGLFRSKKYQQQQKPPANSAPMSRKQAAEILGVKENATPKEIKARYQQLMKQVHPDKGGSEHFAKQLNDAKDILLKK